MSKQDHHDQLLVDMHAFNAVLCGAHAFLKKYFFSSTCHGFARLQHGLCGQYCQFGYFKVAFKQCLSIHSSKNAFTNY